MVVWGHLSMMVMVVAAETRMFWSCGRHLVGAQHSRPGRCKSPTRMIHSMTNTFHSIHEVPSLLWFNSKIGHFSRTEHLHGSYTVIVELVDISRSLTLLLLFHITRFPKDTSCPITIKRNFQRKDTRFSVATASQVLCVIKGVSGGGDMKTRYPPYHEMTTIMGTIRPFFRDVDNYARLTPISPELSRDPTYAAGKKRKSPRSVWVSEAALRTCVSFAEMMWWLEASRCSYCLQWCSSCYARKALSEHKP